MGKRPYPPYRHIRVTAVGFLSRRLNQMVPSYVAQLAKDHVGYKNGPRHKRYGKHYTD